MNIHEILKTASFGQRVAEEESEHLAEYFVETDHWNRLQSGQVDVVYGPKGAGKSALYSLLIARRNEFFDQLTLLVPCENPRGAPAFRALATDPPSTEQEFVALWKLYFACLLSATLKEYGIPGRDAEALHAKLEESGLVTNDASLSRILSSVYDYVKRSLRRHPTAVEFGAKFDNATQLPSGVTAKIIFSEPSESQNKRGYTSVDELVRLGNSALEASGYQVWLLLDRLDVAFSESHELEANALRALFRCYLDLAGLSGVKMKIFLRTDIWRKITSTGFREASHITRHVTIEWSNASLLNLVVRRILKNNTIRTQYEMATEVVLASTSAQQELFYRIFPQQVDVGPNKPETFEWMLSRVRDGAKLSAPRELIHLLNALRAEQARQLELGGSEPENQKLFSRNVFKDALSEVSRTRLEQTLYAEYPDLKQRVEALRGQKTQHSLQSLATIWQVPLNEAERISRALVDVGLFEQRGNAQEPVLWVPFLYRDALDLVQGAAD